MSKPWEKYQATKAPTTGKPWEKFKQKSKAKVEYEPYEEDTTEGMSTAEKLGAGFISGLLNVGQGALDMLPGVDYSAEIAERKALEEDLSGTTEGSIGQFGGEMAALAPLGFIGTGAKAIQAGRAVPSVAARVTTPAMAAATEGAIGGAILADPEERLEGAALGAGGNIVLNKLGAGLNRALNRGIVKKSPESEKFLDTIEVMTGDRPFLPVAMSGDLAENTSAKGVAAVRDAFSMLPSAKTRFENQAKDVVDKTNEAMLRKVFQTKPDGSGTADIAVKVFRETGDMNKATEAALRAKKGAPTMAQEIVKEASRGQQRGVYQPINLRRAIERTAKKADEVPSNMPLYDFANMVEDVAGRAVTGSSVAGRDVFHKADNIISNTLKTTVDAVPFLGKGLSSQRLQKGLTGELPWQRAFQEVMETRGGEAGADIAAAVRRALGVQLSQESDPSYYEQALRSM